MDLREKTRQELLCEIHNLKKTCDYLYNASCNLDDISTFNRKLSSGTEQNGIYPEYACGYYRLSIYACRAGFSY